MVIMLLCPYIKSPGHVGTLCMRACVCVTMHTAVFCLILKVFSSHSRLSHSVLMNSSTFMCTERHTFYTLCHKCEVYKWYFFHSFKWNLELIYYIHVYEKMDDFGCYYYIEQMIGGAIIMLWVICTGINLIVCVWKYHSYIDPLIGYINQR